MDDYLISGLLSFAYRGANAASGGYLSKATEALFNKAVGDGVFAVAKESIKLISSKQNKLPENHDLQKAVRKSMLDATGLVCASLREEQAELEFCKKLQKWVNEQSEPKRLNDIEAWANTGNAAEGNTELFFATQEEYKEKKDLLTNQMTSDWLQYVSSELVNDRATTETERPTANELPYAFRHRMRNEFRLGGKRMKWADAVMVTFAELLRDKKSELGASANDAFTQNFLSEIKLGQDELKKMTTEILRLVRDSFPNHEDILSLNAETMKSQQDLLVAKHKTIEELRVELKEVRAEMKEVNELRFIAATEGATAKGKAIALKEQLDKLEKKYEAILSENAILKQEAVAERKETIDTLKEEGKDDDLLKEAARLMEEGRFKEARDLQIQSAERLKVLSKESAKDAAQQYLELADLDEKELRYADALLHYREAAQLQPEEPLYLNDLGYFLDTMALHDEAINYLEKALGLLTTTDDHQKLKGTVLNNLGSIWISKGEYDKAIDYFKQALALNLKVFGEEHPDTAAHLNNLGEAWRAKGGYDKAMDYYEQALAILRNIFGEMHTYVASTLNNLGLAWDSKGKYDKAIDYYKKALIIDRKVLGEVHPSVARDLNNLGVSWDAKGEYDKAIDYYEQALKIDQKVLGEGHPKVATRLNNLGAAWKSKGEYDKAIDYYKQALKIDIKALGEEHPNVGTRFFNLGATNYRKQEYTIALSYLEKAEKIYLKFLGEEHPDTKNLRVWLKEARTALASQTPPPTE